MIGTLLLTFAACKKSPETIGNNLISDSNYIGVFHTDTVEVVCYSYLDSVSTRNASNALLGALNDPVFGSTEAGFYTQIRPSVAGQSFGNQPVLDSLVLQLYITGYYGDTNVMQTAHVFVLSDTLSMNGTYYNTSDVVTDATDHANGYQFMPHPRTKTSVFGTDTVGVPVVRIPLSEELGYTLLNLDTVDYSRPDLFKEHFKGLFVTCNSVAQDGAILSINLTSNTFTMLNLYYHDASTPDKAMRYDYYVTSSDTYFNHCEHDYSQGSPDFTDQVLNHQEALGQQQVYLQTMGGVRTRIFFPNLPQWQEAIEEGHVIINEAKLVLPVAQALMDSVYTAPSSLSLVGFNTDSTTYLLPDYFEGTTYFGGSYSASHHSTTFRISEYMQSVIDGKDDHGLCLGINGSSYNSQRMVINGPEATEGERMCLMVTYSIVNE